jgi:DNA-binding NarL/FixJ family response regulator
MAIRVLLVDDQALFREGLETLLSVHSDIQVVGQASNGQEAVEVAAEVHPDVVLMDVRMPVLDGVGATRLLKDALPQCRVIVLTTFDDDEYIFDALRTGAAGYLLKDVASARLVEAIRATARGESILEPSVAAKVIAEFTRVSSMVPSAQMEQLVEPLSERELEILAWIARGSSNKEIADQLFIAEGTVKNHVTHILGKLGVRDRTQAALKARELGLL